MKQFSDQYTFLFATIMVFVVALLLSFAAISLQPVQNRNVQIEKKRRILAAMNISSNNKNADERFSRFITAALLTNVHGDIDTIGDAFSIELKTEMSKDDKEKQLPVFIGSLPDKKHIYILPLFGKGLWGPIYGYMALKNDMSTVYGVYFDHDKETPGLGAEINKQPFQTQFRGKKILDNSGRLQYIKVTKGGANSENAVDAISGGTITSKGVEDMIQRCLTLYSNYLLKNTHHE